MKELVIDIMFYGMMTIMVLCIAFLIYYKIQTYRTYRKSIKYYELDWINDEEGFTAHRRIKTYFKTYVDYFTKDQQVYELQYGYTGLGTEIKWSTVATKMYSRKEVPQLIELVSDLYIERRRLMEAYEAQWNSEEFEPFKN